MKNQFQTPILFLIFNRPKETEKVFEQIRLLKPKFLFVAADGPRAEKVNEDKICKKTRDIVLNGIDWDCKLYSLLRDENLGCGKAVSKAISWFFDNVEYGIILEDDCLPNLSFFQYAEELLIRYRNNDKIMHVGGSNFLFKKKRIKSSYYYSTYPLIWGWGTWKRAWEKYNFKFKGLEEFFEKNLTKSYFRNETIKNYWYNIFKSCDNGEIDTWDYQWIYTLWKNNGISVLPQINLITNIGFGSEATHCLNNANNSNIQSENLIFPLNHPKKIKIDRKADYLHFSEVHQNIPPLIFKLKSGLRKSITSMGMGKIYTIKDKLLTSKN